MKNCGNIRKKLIEQIIEQKNRMIPAAWTPNFSIQAGWAGRLAGQAVGRQAGNWGHLGRFSTVSDGNLAATQRQAGPEPGTGACTTPGTKQKKARKNPTVT